jgi:deoxycytidine triphosphate deaminase
VNALAAELSRALELRLAYLEEFLREVRGELHSGRHGVRDALRLAEHYPNWIREFANSAARAAPTDQQRVDIFRALLALVSRKAEFVETWLSGARALRVPLSLIRGVERACEELGLGRRKAVVAVGPPGRYETFVADLRAYLFSGITPAPPLPRDLPADLRSSRFTLMLIPRFEGGEALWRPVILGHELAHLRVRAKRVMAGFNLRGRVDWPRIEAAGLPPFPRTLGLTQRLALEKIASSWVEELICDAYAARRFGPAGVAALSEFLDVVGTTEAASYTHPPGWLRVRLLTGWVTPLTNSRFERVLEPWRQLAGSPQPAFDPWVTALVSELEQLSSDYWALLAGWPSQYNAESRTRSVERSADALREGLPCSSVYFGDPRKRPYAQDAINAGWLERIEDCDKPVSQLVAKSLDDIEFVRLWRGAGGEFIQSDPAQPPPTRPSGVLSGEEIRRRIRVRGADRLIVTPLLPPSLGTAAVDLRLGSMFITFRRSGVASFDPLSDVEDPRSMQEGVEKEWGEAFILHPGELVLASTLEYLGLPADLSGQVVTRSSYGRLGLITATAIQVHPHFKGCLTLELLNLGEVPLELVPGERIAQLVLTIVDPPAAESEGKYTYPVKPEFSKVRTDAEASVLRRLRREVQVRYGPVAGRGHAS